MRRGWRRSGGGLAADARTRELSNHFAPPAARATGVRSIELSSHSDEARGLVAGSREPGAAWLAVRAVRDVPLAGERKRKTFASLSEYQPRAFNRHAASGPCYPTRRPQRRADLRLRRVRPASEQPGCRSRARDARRERAPPPGGCLCITTWPRRPSTPRTGRVAGPIYSRTLITTRRFSARLLAVLVVGHRLGLAVRDDLQAAQRDPVLLVQVVAHRQGPLLAQLRLYASGPDRVGVSLDLDEDALVLAA